MQQNLLKDAPVKVTLIDKRNFHLFQPLLYQVATGTLSPADIASPLRVILSKHKNTKVLLDKVVDIDPEAKKVFSRRQRRIRLRCFEWWQRELVITTLVTISGRTMPLV